MTIFESLSLLRFAVMYRDARPSVKARVKALEDELIVAEDGLASLLAKRKRFPLLLFPLFEDFWANIRSLKGPEEHAVVYILLSPIYCLALLGLSIAIMPKVFVTMGLRAKRGAIRRLKGRLKSLRHELRGTRESLLALEEGSAQDTEE